MTARDDLPEGLRDSVEGPIVQLTFERCLCPLHGEPFRENWPSGYPIFMVRGFQLVAGLDPELNHPDGLSDGQRFAFFELKLSERPVCCRIAALDRGKLLDLYLESRDHEHSKAKWKRRICDLCGELRPGSKFKARRAENDPRVIEKRHVCLNCVVFHESRFGMQRPD